MAAVALCFCGILTIGYGIKVSAWIHIIRGNQDTRREKESSAHVHFYSLFIAEKTLFCRLVVCTFLHCVVSVFLSHTNFSSRAAIHIDPAHRSQLNKACLFKALSIWKKRIKCRICCYDSTVSSFNCFYLFILLELSRKCEKFDVPKHIIRNEWTLSEYFSRFFSSAVHFYCSFSNAHNLCKSAERMSGFKSIISSLSFMV